MTAAARRLAKRLLAQGVVRTGCWSLARRAWARRGTTVILTYHRVLEKMDTALDSSQPGMVVTVSTFERHLDFLERHFELTPLGALLDDERPGRRGRRPRCVITFDDGWRDNHELALPVLRRRGVPATIFLTTDFIGTERAFWHTELIHVLRHGELAPLLRDARALAAYPAAVREALRRYAERGPGAGADDVDPVVETVKATCEEPVIHELVETLARGAGLRRPLCPGRRFFLDWDQVREMAASGFEVGSHGCSHRIMTRLSARDAAEELDRSKAEIERQVGRPVRHFAFPNEDASEALVRAVARAGYETACVGDYGAGAPPAGLRTVRRVGMHEGVSPAGSWSGQALLGLSLLRGPRWTPA
jgi:peptidoglycan/xylan/chitin deacetylase (PgdA/CDA1 family)